LITNEEEVWGEERDEEGALALAKYAPASDAAALAELVEVLLLLGRQDAAVQAHHARRCHTL